VSQVYWTSIFILPRKVILDIEQKFNRFLWNGKVEGVVARAKVAWRDLGIKNLGGLEPCFYVNVEAYIFGEFLLDQDLFGWLG
jgi:hypothetical protein